MTSQMYANITNIPALSDSDLEKFTYYGDMSETNISPYNRGESESTNLWNVLNALVLILYRVVAL